MAAAYGAAGEALESGQVARAVELLQWAKSAASRSAAVREALGVALYHAGDYAAATTELLAYRRLSGREDQNHVLADCARALGRGEKVAEYVEAMDPATVGADRYAEAVIVLAAHQADEGDLDRAIQTIERLAGEPARVADWHLRVWYLAADLHERRGDTASARDYLEAISAVDGEYLDVEDRLERLDGS